MLWYSTVNDVYNKPQTAGIDIDFFNTLSTGRIASILFMEDTPEKVQYLKSFSRWIDNGCFPAEGLNDGNKPKGPIEPVGGLAGLIRQIEAVGGVVTIEWTPRYSLTVKLICTC